MKTEWHKVTTLLLIAASVCATYASVALASGVILPNNKPLALVVSEAPDTTTWNEYTSSRYQFSVKYPQELVVDTSTVSLGVSGQVIAFTPISYEPYSGTNLVDYYVVIGITASLSPDSSAREVKTKAVYAIETRTGQCFEKDGVYFYEYYAFEGAAGHQYEKTSYRTVLGGVRYEIALLIHSVSCGALPGEVTGFDAAKLMGMFGAMARTFTLEGTF